MTDKLDKIIAKCEQYWNAPIEAPETHAALEQIHTWAHKAKDDNAALEQRVRGLEKAGTDAFLSDDGLLWIGKAEDEHGYGMEFIGITLPKDRYFAFLEALAEEEA